MNLFKILLVFFATSFQFGNAVAQVTERTIDEVKQESLARAQRGLIRSVDLTRRMLRRHLIASRPMTETSGPVAGVMWPRAIWRKVAQPALRPKRQPPTKKLGDFTISRSGRFRIHPEKL